jgi:hypothetical protein
MQMDSEGSVACTDLGITNDREGAGDEQAAQIAVPLFTDTGEPILAAKRSFLAPAGNAQILISDFSLRAPQSALTFSGTLSGTLVGARSGAGAGAGVWAGFGTVSGMSIGVEPG